MGDFFFFFLWLCFANDPEKPNNFIQNLAQRTYESECFADADSKEAAVQAMQFVDGGEG